MITGNVKFLTQNRIDDNTTITATSALSANFSKLYDNDRNTKLISVGSSDGVDEDFTFTLSSSAYFDRIHINAHNIKTGNIQYYDGGWKDFSPAISWTDNTSTSADYFEFTEVYGDMVRLQCSHTIDSGEKSVGEFTLCSEIGTVNANPVEWSFEFDEFNVLHRTSNAGNIYTFFGSKYIASLLFNDADDTDVALFKELKDRSREFYIFPCGGITTHTQIGFRTQDIFLVNYVNNFKPELKENLLGIGTVITLDLREV